MIGIRDDDPRPLTLTGGLGFFGGPGNNYSLHGVVTLAEKISTGQRSSGLVTALGWFMHKHAAGIYGSIPSTTTIRGRHSQDMQSPLVGEAPVQIEDQVTGIGVVETYTIVFSTDQQPAYAVLYGKTRDNFRFIARTRSHPDIFKELTLANRVGQRVKIHFDAAQKMNIAEFI
jgi:acetyl-CoA C-acetyltransferase